MCLLRLLLLFIHVPSKSMGVLFLSNVPHALGISWINPFHLEIANAAISSEQTGDKPVTSYLDMSTHLVIPAFLSTPADRQNVVMVELR